MDVYRCNECTKAFAVEINEDVERCPYCESDSYEFSHEVIAVQK